MTISLWLGLYVSLNHWFRNWYNLAIENLEVDATRDGVRGPFKAMVVAGDEHTSLSRAYIDGVHLAFYMRICA